MIKEETPCDLQDAIEKLKILLNTSIEKVRLMSEDDFMSSAHMGMGGYIRNSWNLWWHENHKYETWPKEKPILIKFFNDLGIYHADDISGIILTSFYREICGLPVNLELQISKYKKYWKSEGFENGIFIYQ